MWDFENPTPTPWQKYLFLLGGDDDYILQQNFVLQVRRQRIRKKPWRRAMGAR